jgi:O-antigen/teichoic acid export membrane protein
MLLGSTAILWAGEFFRLWLGATYAEPADYPSVANLFYLLALASIIAVGQRVGYQILLATRNVKLLAMMSGAEALSNLLLSVILLSTHGLIGVALGTLIPTALFQGVLQPLFVCRTIGISLDRYCREVLLRPMIVLLVLSVLFASSPLWGHAHDWPMLLLAGAVSLGVASFVVLLLGFTQSERQWFFCRPGVLLRSINPVSAARHRVNLQ